MTDQEKFEGFKQKMIDENEMYVEDARFAAYYDAVRPGAAVFLRDAVLIYTGMKK